MVEGTPQKRGWTFWDYLIVLSVVVLASLAFIRMRTEIGAIVAPLFGYTVDSASAPLIPTARPIPTSAPIAPQQAPIVIRVENTDPAPNIAVQPAQQAIQPISDSAETQPTTAPVVVIVQRVTDNGGQVITGSGACQVSKRVAVRCGK